MAMAEIINGTLWIPALNGTLIPKDDCALNVCSLDYAQIEYVPTYGGNLAYLIVFAVLLVAQCGLVWKYRTWGFWVGMFCGLLLEVLGYDGRVTLNGNPFNFDQFVLYLVCLTIGPAFLTASIYLCLGRLVIVFGEGISRFSPKFYTITFMTCDFLSLLLQAVGGALAATQDDTNPSDTGVNIMIAGLAFQIVSLTIFIALSLEFAWRARKARESDLNFEFFNLRKRTMFRLLPYAIAIATITIYIRCVFRVAELQDGFGGELANNEGMFMAFEGPMIIIAVVVLTICHPGIAFGSASAWKAANWTWKKGNKSESGSNHIRMESRETAPPSVLESEDELSKHRV
ncbi:putative RTA1 domain protein [Aureobasidium pullulans]|uniref:Putative RTA1 domain protein n=2 Tax=Aureobasidium pullulans TaxID=5580 RepID=A0A4T0CG28_AURPU|nr:putative RTA1 domain protein [Aureobasidium pullulans]